MYKINTSELNRIYLLYNKKELIHPDPLEFVYNYNDQKDREISALIASSLAYGKVNQILKSVKRILDKMLPTPYEFILSNSHEKFCSCFSGFKHRFTTDEDLVNLMMGIKYVLIKYESLEKCLLSNFSQDDVNILKAVNCFAYELSSYYSTKRSYLLPRPEHGSACKRIMLFLRWMVRNDEVDPGCWKTISASKLIIPVDTHMHKIGIKLGLTCRKSADIKTAIEITNAFKTYCPEDPTKYDFALTRFGIRDELSYKIFDNNHLS